MTLTRGLVDFMMVATAASKVGCSLLNSQSSALAHHVKVSAVSVVSKVEHSSQETLSTINTITAEPHVQHPTPIDTPSVPITPIEQVPVEQAPIEKTPIEKTPIEKTPVEQTPVEKTTIIEESREHVSAQVGAKEKSQRSTHTNLKTTSLGMGAINESVKRAVGLSDNSGGSVMMSEKNVDRLVDKLSRMRGAALKMGQMISIQGIQAAGGEKSVMPSQLEQVLLRVHDSANYMPKAQMEKVLTQELGQDWRSYFAEFDPIPIAAASIGQVHAATLASTGQHVVIKIQYPGVAESIDSDLSNLKALITFSNLLPPGLYLDNTIKVTKQELAWECDYHREADNALRFHDLLKDDARYKVPVVIKDLSTERILVSERLKGRVLSKAVDESQAMRNKLGEGILRLCLREVFSFQFMQTDPNWSNFFYNPRNGQIELLDFGACRAFPDKFLALYGRILVSASKGDREGVWEYSKQLGFVTGYETKIMQDAHIDSVMVLGEPFQQTSPDNYDFEKQTITARIRDTIPVMLRHRLTPPPDETYGLHKKLSGAFLLCTKLGSKFNTKAVWDEEVSLKFR
ncbi:ABC1 family-domain-containing protein [Spinellus fusiger]|nr:ABC1 family-domain-containing protein [Spinellus fusiger]